MTKSAGSDIIALLISVSAALFLIAFYVVFTEEVVPAYLILGISIFTFILSTADIVHLTDVAVYDKENPKDQKNLKLLYKIRFWLITLSMPAAVSVVMFFNFKGRSETEISNTANVFTLVALAVVLYSIALRFYGSSIDNNIQEETVEN